MALKHRLAATIRAIGLNRVIAAALNGCLWLVTSLGKIVAQMYGRLWGLLGVRFYDQRFTCAGGPRNWRWAERGYYAYMAGKPGDTVLDLCCGEGLFPGVFMSQLGGSVDGMDRDPHGIASAKRRYGASNVAFFVGDVVADPFPRERYDLISCFATFQYLTIEDAHRLLGKITSALNEPNAVFVGSVPILTAPMPLDYGAVHNFRSVEEVVHMMSAHFENVSTWCSIWQPGEVHCYFTCAKSRAVEQHHLIDEVHRHKATYPYQARSIA